MEKKALLAFGIAAAFLYVYFQWVMPKFAPPRTDAPAPADAPETVRPATPIAAPVAGENAPRTGETVPTPAGTSASFPPQSDAPERKISIRTDRYRMTWTTKGATLEFLELADYPDATRKQGLALFTPREGLRPFMLGVVASGRKDVHLLDRSWKVVEEEANRKIVFETETGGLVVRKTIRFRPADYAMDVELSFSGTAPGTGELGFLLYGPVELRAEEKVKSAYWFSTERVREKDGVVSVKWSQGLPSKEPREGKRRANNSILWAGAQGRYFAGILFPEKESDTIAWIDAPLLDPEENVVSRSVALEARPVRLAEGPGVRRYIFYAGPLKADALRAAHPGLEPLLAYCKWSWVDAICRVLLAVMHGAYRVIPNYGIAIIFLTILVRLVLFPVSLKQQSSMFRYQEKMQRLKPRVDAIKEKYKGNRQKLNQETMALYREEGISPMAMGGGCLLMVFQMPVFIGLYNTICYSIDLRQAKFFLWIRDLSEPDTLFLLPGGIPLLGGVGVNPLPLALVGLMFLQQRMTPKPADPDQAQQQKMMMWMMPAMFLFFFYTMPAGLTLYFVMSTGFGLLEQVLIRKRMAREKAAAAVAMP
ncbi:MAG: membrane protein insertase YidC [Planctomycetota bacterium]